MYRMYHAMLALAAAAVILAGPAQSAQADTVGYWRFEDGALEDDSSGNGNDLSTATVSGGTAPAAYALPATGAGSDFPDPVLQNGLSNGQGSEQFDGGWWNAGNGDNQFVASSFTVEAFINAAESGTGDNQRTIASVYGNVDADQAWFLRVKSKGDANDGEITLRVEDGTGSGDNVRPVAKITLGKDYYIAAVFTPDTVADANADGSVTFYLQNLTDGGSLVSETVATDAAAPNASITQDLQIGRGNGNEFVGILDEVRYSNTALEQSDLLIVPEPASVFAGLGLLGALGLRRKRA